MRLPAFFISLLMTFPLLAKGPEPGYGGLKWEDPPQADMKRLEGSPAGLSYFSRGPAHVFCGVTVAARYLFYKERLLSVNLSGFAEEFVPMSTCLTKLWGAPEAIGSGLVWKTPATHVTLEPRPPEKGGGYHILIVGQKLWAAFTADEKRAKGQ